MAENTGSGVLQTINGQLDQLSPRDRKALTVLVLFVLVLVAALFTWFLKGSLDDAASRVRAAKDTFEVMAVMEEQYLEAQATVTRSEARLRQYQGERFSAFMERIAQQTRVQENLRTVDEVGKESLGGIQQTRYNVELKKVGYAAAVDFLYDLETSGYPMRIENANFKTVFSAGERQLDLRLEIVTLSLEEA